MSPNAWRSLIAVLCLELFIVAVVMAACELANRHVEAPSHGATTVAVYPPGEP